MFERIETLIDDLRAFAADATVVPLPFSFASQEPGAGLLQLAAGRTPAALDSRKPARPDFHAAQRFLAKVVFDARNDYFTLLCVHRNASHEAIKENYRRLIALVHPDANPTGFPADAASRVNLGYAVLSNAEARASYTKSLDGPPAISAVSATAHQSVPHGLRVGSKPQRYRPPRRLFAWIQRPGFGVGLLVLAAMLMLPVVLLLANMATDPAGERLISGNERAEPKHAALRAEPAASRATRTAGTTGQLDAAAAVETGSSLTRATPSDQSGYPIRTESVVVPEAGLVKVPQGAARNSAVPLPNVPVVPEAGTLVPVKPSSATLAVAPMPGRLLDPVEPVEPVELGSAAYGTQSSRVNSPQTAGSALLDASSQSASNAALTTQTATKGQPTATAQNALASAARITDARSRDSEDALLLFGSAFEQGSVENVRTLFAAAMPGRSQMIADYQRVFSTTKQRNIRFLQLKHTVAGQRVSTVGQAVVNTVSSDNKSSSQRVFLEIEVARTGNEVKIERMSNYALD